MGYFTKSVMGAFVAANTIAAIGSYQGIKEMAENPFLSQEEVKTAMSKRPIDNLARVVLGNQGEQYTLYSKMGLGVDDSIDARLSRYFGNKVLNRHDIDNTYDKTRLPKMTGLTAMVLTAPGSYFGGVIGYNVAHISAE